MTKVSDSLDPFRAHLSSLKEEIHMYELFGDVDEDQLFNDQLLLERKEWYTSLYLSSI